MDIMKFKYKTELDYLLSLGLTLPDLSEPKDKIAYRFIFKDIPEKNHIPVYIQKPRRALSDIEKSKATTSGYALSCFEEEDKAKEKFQLLASNFHNIKKTIGDSISVGTIVFSDGLISPADINTTHFDLYEFSECNLSNTFVYKEEL